MKCTGDRMLTLLLAAAACAAAGCAGTNEVYRPMPAEQVLDVRLGPVIPLLGSQANYDVRAIADAAGIVHVLVAAYATHELLEFVVGEESVSERRVVGALPRDWLGAASFVTLDAAYDAQGRLHAIAGDAHYMCADGAWQPSDHTPWQEVGIKVESIRFAPGAPRLIWVFEARGRDVGARPRWDLWGFGGAGGALVWPWRTHGRRTVIVPETASGYPHWTVLDPQGRRDTLTAAVAADGHGNVYVLYDADVGGLLTSPRGIVSPPDQSGGFYATMAGAVIADAPAGDADRSRAGAPPRHMYALTGQPVPHAFSPITLAADAQSGAVLAGTDWLIRDGHWSGPLKGSPGGYGHVAPAGNDHFHAVIAGVDLHDVSAKIRNIPVRYTLFSGAEWSQPLEVGVANMGLVLGWIPRAMDIAAAPDGRAFVVWPAADGLVGRWVQPRAPIGERARLRPSSPRIPIMDSRSRG